MTMSSRGGRPAPAPGWRCSSASGRAADVAAGWLGPGGPLYLWRTDVAGRVRELGELLFGPQGRVPEPGLVRRHRHAGPSPGPCRPVRARRTLELPGDAAARAGGTATADRYTAWLGAPARLRDRAGPDGAGPDGAGPDAR